MKIRVLSARRSALHGFTLVELLVSTTLIAGIMLLLLGTVDQTQRVYQRSVSKTTQFQAARAAFDAMSRRLSQATLNTYWKAHEASIAQSADKAEFKFRRQSDLQFVSGPTKRFFEVNPSLANINSPISENYPGDSVFFSAPIGHTEYVDPSPAKNPGKVKLLRSLDSTLAACGYFVEFGDDPAMPSVVRKSDPPYPPRYRYRLMEMTVPAEDFNPYWRDDLGNAPTWDLNPRIFDEKKSYYGGLVDKDRQPIAAFVRPYWMAQALIRPSLSSGGNTVNRFFYAHSIGENILALIVLPKLAVKDRVPTADTLELAPKYEFDSWRVLSGGTENDPVHTSVKLDNRARDNLLPPIVQLTMVAIDEPSAIRMNLKMTGKPKWLDNLFHLGPQTQPPVTETEYIEDVGKLEKAIRDDKEHPNIQYRIFTTDVIIRGSKWSREPR